MSMTFEKLSLLGLAALTIGCRDTPTASAPPPASRAAPVGDNDTSAVIDGALAGSLYRLFRPAHWNGRLLLYAHGTVRPDRPIALPAEGQAVILLAALESTATAFSSFRENGWAVKDGGQRTEQLRGIFTSKFGRPTRTYVAGGS